MDPGHQFPWWGLQCWRGLGGLPMPPGNPPSPARGPATSHLEMTSHSTGPRECPHFSSPSQIRLVPCASHQLTQARASGSLLLGWIHLLEWLTGLRATRWLIRSPVYYKRREKAQEEPKGTDTQGVAHPHPESTPLSEPPWNPRQPRSSQNSHPLQVLGWLLYLAVIEYIFGLWQADSTSSPSPLPRGQGTHAL